MGPRQVGTFAGYGVDMPIALSPGTGSAPVALPLCALIAGWVRGQVEPDAALEVRAYADDRDVDAALQRGRQLRAEIDEAADPIGVLVVADGAHTLTPPAPGGYDPESIPVQDALDDALAAWRRRRADPAARRDRRPGRLPGAGRADGTGAAIGQGALPRRAVRRRLLRRRLATMSRPIAIIGPTGTGKSALALAVAERVGGEIVNADAMQLYRGMDIGTAKLTVAERRGIPHHQLDVLDVTETATVARYQQAAAADIEAIAARGAVPIVVGGSMMYIQSLLDEWAFPATDPAGAGQMGAAARRGRRRRACTPSWHGSTPRRRLRSCPPTAAASCGRWRSSS